MKYTSNQILIARNIRLLRIRKLESIFSIANFLGFTEVDYIQFELGYRDIQIEQLIMIADYYNVSIDFLLMSDDVIH